MASTCLGVDARASPVAGWAPPAAGTHALAVVDTAAGIGREVNVGTCAGVGLRDDVAALERTVFLFIDQADGRGAVDRLAVACKRLRAIAG